MKNFTVAIETYKQIKFLKWTLSAVGKTTLKIFSSHQKFRAYTDQIDMI